MVLLAVSKMILPYRSETCSRVAANEGGGGGDATAGIVALALSSVAFAAWIGTGVIEVETVVRGVGLAAFVVLFVTALSAWVVGMIVGCFELGAAAAARTLHRRRHCLALASLVLSLTAPPASIVVSLIAR
jgi:hypothetical protein